MSNPEPFYVLPSAIAFKKHVGFSVQKVSEFTFKKGEGLTKGNEEAGRLNEDLLNTEIQIDMNQMAEHLPYSDFFDVLVERRRQYGTTSLQETVENCPIV
uniref:Phage protein n=1 Tax=Steinernema glaseri TaxID=37863 RepID=A0A1I7Y394_9BILA